MFDVNQEQCEPLGAHLRHRPFFSVSFRPMSVITPDLLTRFDVPGPRYTSYPTADRFVEAVPDVLEITRVTP